MKSCIYVGSDKKLYASPIIGNGQMVTRIGPTGFHNGYGTEENHMDFITEKKDRCIFWQGRRLENGPWFSLMGFGKITRELKINDNLSLVGYNKSNMWKQWIDYNEGFVTSQLTHICGIVETTYSRILLNHNILLIQTQWENHSETQTEIQETIEYSIGNFDGSYPNLLSREEKKEYKDVNYISIPFHYVLNTGINAHIEGAGNCGCVNVGIIASDKAETILKGENGDNRRSGGFFKLKTVINPKEVKRRYVFVILSDRDSYEHLVSSENIDLLIAEHNAGWEKFYNQSQIDVCNDDINRMYLSSLYTLRINASPWSIPPAILSSTWDGRMFHDEFYPFMALSTLNRIDIAKNIPNFRLKTLTKALEQGAYQGARYSWESLENGNEGGCYGYWAGSSADFLGQRFHMGIIVETAYQFCLKMNSIETYEEFYPLIKECANFLEYDVLRVDKYGNYGTRPLTDYDELESPLQNGIYTMCAMIRSFEVAARVAQYLGKDKKKVQKWRLYVQKITKNLPVDEKEELYLTSDKAHHYHIAMVGPIFPFCIDVKSKRAHNSIIKLLKTCKNKFGYEPSNVMYKNNGWMWTPTHLAIALCYMGDINAAYTLIKESLMVSGCFMSPVERTWESGVYSCSWFTTAAGSFLYALSSIFFKNINGELELLVAIPEELKNYSIQNICIYDGVTFSAKVVEGELLDLSITSDEDVNLEFYTNILYLKAIDDKYVKTIKSNRLLCNCNIRQKETVQLTTNNLMK